MSNNRVLSSFDDYCEFISFRFNSKFLAIFYSLDFFVSFFIKEKRNVCFIVDYSKANNLLIKVS